MLAPKNDTTNASHWRRASIVNSLLLPPAAALQFDATFWILVVSNFMLMHAVWVVQLAGHKQWSAIDFGLVKWPLIAFAALGNLGLFIGGERLLTVFAT